MGSTARISSTALLLAASLVSQEYRTERDETLGLEFRVHDKLIRSNAPGGVAPLYRFWYEPGGAGDYINTKYGAFTWYMFILEFPKNLEGVPERQIRGRTFREWATEGDSSINDRKFLVENERRRARGKQLEHRWWEYTDSVTVKVQHSGPLIGLRGEQEEVKQPLYFVAAVYDQPDREIALVGVIPIKDFRTLKPDARFKGYLATMATSLQFFEPTTPAGDNQTPRDRMLAQAKTFADSSQGWDFVAGSTHVVLYSWEPDRDSRKRNSERFATKVNEQLEQMHELFTQELPAHPDQVLYFPVARVWHDYEGFMHSSGTSESGEVADFNLQTHEIVLFFDKDRERVNSESELFSALNEAAWRQHAFFYFYVQTPVDLHRWYEMGLAAWFGSHTSSGSRISYRPDRERVRIIRAAVDDGSYPDLETFLTLSSDEFDGRGSDVHEAQAWALVDFLKRGGETGGFDPAWGKILDTYRSSALENRSPRRALADAIEGIDLHRLEAAWVDWVKNELR